MPRLSQPPFRRLSWQDLDPAALRHWIELARDEDLFGLGLRDRPGRSGDPTSACLPPGGRGTARLTARDPLRVCGLPLISLVAEGYGVPIEVELHYHDGEAVPAGACLATLAGEPAHLLRTERVLLNFLQHLSGIATLTAEYVALLQDSSTRLLDTRKTLPGYRMLQKYAVACGGGWNHRLGLFDWILIKDNHLAAAGNTSGDRLAAAVARAREEAGESGVVEVEIDRLEQLEPVLQAGADIVLFDNFPPSELRRAVAQLDGRAWSEASGGIDRRNLPAIGRLGLDFISSGAMVHQSVWKDIALDWEEGTGTE